MKDDNRDRGIAGDVEIEIVELESRFDLALDPLGLVAGGDWCGDHCTNNTCGDNCGNNCTQNDIEG